MENTAYGVFCPLYSPTIVELIGHLGFDFVLLDAEHSPIAPESCEHMVRAVDSVGLLFIYQGSYEYSAECTSLS